MFWQKFFHPISPKSALYTFNTASKSATKTLVSFQPVEQTDSTDQSFLFFPALCSVDKSQVVWEEPTGNSFSIGWLALCTDPHDYFPPRFLHVLLLRLVYTLTLSAPAQLQTAHASPVHGRRCTMWKTGVQLVHDRQGVDCMVELVSGSQGGGGLHQEL